MKKKLILFSCVLLVIIILCFLFLYTLFPTLSINNNYDLVNGVDFDIPNSSLKFYSVEYDGISTHLLGFKNAEEQKLGEELLIDKENGKISSYRVGKNCIFITSSILDVNAVVTETISEDVLNRINMELTQNKETEIIVNNKETANPYIISKNDKILFIDFITMLPESKSKLAYYRVIVEDVSNVTPELTEEDISILEDYLPELLEIFGITENVEVPK